VAFVNYYIHQVNLLRLLLGEPYRVAHGNERLLVAETETGKVGSIELAPYETATGWDESILLGFDKAAVRVSLLPPLANARAGEVEVRLSSEVLRPNLPPLSAMRRQAQNFIASLSGQEKPACEAAEALEDLIVAQSWLEMSRRSSFTRE
jgi:hypothetical protein